MVSSRVTARDVARRAGVSQATVSYVLNDDPRQSIPTETRERVLGAAAELGYTPLASARILRRGRSDIVVMLIPDWPLGPVLPDVVDAASRGLDERGLELFLHRCSRTRPVRDLWAAITPAAVVRLGSLGAEEDESLRRSQIGYLLELANSELEDGLVLFPGVQTGRLQGEHLAARGHRRLGYAWPVDDRLSGFATARLAGVSDASADLGLEPPVVADVGFGPGGADDAVRRWLDAGVTGIAAFNDHVAMAVMASAQRQGVAVPASWGVVGVDNVPWGEHCDPPLTTIAPAPESIGQVIAERVLAGLDDREPRVAGGDRFVSLIERASA